jgi:2-polyprenyl-3-methyl-5-hydroxy-6-metoxy-1,4-benzoquinol methylase
MSKTKDHYDQHLGPIYEWMVGDFDTAVQPSLEFFELAGVHPMGNGRAVDLGCGHGLQSIPLADAGYKVLAIDSCLHLLDSLTKRAIGKSVTTAHDCIENYVNQLDGEVEAIVCMGDTLTHLESVESALTIVQQAAERLSEGGCLCLSFRDYSEEPLRDLSRFILVKSSPERIHTCCLEDCESAIRVTDLVHTKENEVWNMFASSYMKVKISPDVLKQSAKEYGLTLTAENSMRGMLYLAFRR